MKPFLLATLSLGFASWNLPWLLRGDLFAIGCFAVCLFVAGWLFGHALPACVVRRWFLGLWGAR